MPKRTSPKKRQSDFRLPPGVSMQKEQLPAGWAYVFRHAELGLLGRLVLQGLPGGHCQVSCEVAGDPTDPLTGRRRKVLEPVTTALIERLEAQTAIFPGTPWVVPPASPLAPRRLIESKLIQCEQCDAGVALLIFADEATDHGGLEDYARLMYQQIQATNLPTWVIGPPQGEEPPPCGRRIFCKSGPHANRCAACGRTNSTRSSRRSPAPIAADHAAGRDNTGRATQHVVRIASSPVPCCPCGSTGTVRQFLIPVDGAGEGKALPDRYPPW
jgi:hypothetical protein